MFTFAVPRAVIGVGVAALIIVSAAACQAREGTTGSDVPPTTHPTAVQALIADAQAARTQHDLRTLHRVQARLADLVGTAATARAEATYRQVRADLATADAMHDARAQTRARVRLHVLCDPAGVTSALGFCDVVPTSPGD